MTAGPRVRRVERMTAARPILLEKTVEAMIAVRRGRPIRGGVGMTGVHRVRRANGTTAVRRFRAANGTTAAHRVRLVEATTAVRPPAVSG